MTETAEPGRPRRRRKWLLWVLGGVLGAIVAIIFAPFILNAAYSGLARFFACSDAEEAALMEFPHYGGVTAEPEGGDSGSCGVDLAVDDPPGDVVAYYLEQLTEHGWTIDYSGPPEGGPTEGETAEGGGALETGVITAHRDGLFYDVFYEAVEGLTTTLEVHVSEA